MTLQPTELALLAFFAAGILFGLFISWFFGRAMRAIEEYWYDDDGGRQ